MSSAKMDEAKGRVKEAAGALTGNTKMKTEGKLDQAAAKAKKAAGDVVDAVKSTVKKPS